MNFTSLFIWTVILSKDQGTNKNEEKTSELVYMGEEGGSNQLEIVQRATNSSGYKGD